ncbi:hypothetical protein EON65_44865 [archaeon]|nr:MAG: hypothetical protein EON65_44865 [archaeon]
MSRDHPTSAVPVLQFLADFSTHHPGQVYDPASVTDKQMRGSMRVLLYSGEFDLNCNTLGTMHTLEANYWRKRCGDELLLHFSLWLIGVYVPL